MRIEDRIFPDLETAEDLLKVLTNLREKGHDLSTIVLDNGHSAGFQATLMKEELTDFSIVHDLILG